MYQFEDKEMRTVMNLDTGERNIHPGVWKWKIYQEYLAAGGITLLPEVTTDRDVANIVSRIKEKSLSCMFEGVKIGKTWYNTDNENRLRYSLIHGHAVRKLIEGEKGDYLIPGVTIFDCHGNEVQVSLRLMFDIVDTIMVNDQKIAQAAANHSKKVGESLEPTRYDFSSGWPETYKDLREENQ
jgi:hypothetical protein